MNTCNEFALPEIESKKRHKDSLAWKSDNITKEGVPWGGDAETSYSVDVEGSTTGLEDRDTWSRISLWTCREIFGLASGWTMSAESRQRIRQVNGAAWGRSNE